MSRIQIPLPETFIFSTNISVRITDLNYGAHLGNDSLLSILHEARVQFLKHFGYTELNIEGNGIIMSDVAIQYQSEAFYEDILQIEMGIQEFTRVSFDIVYRVTCKQRSIALAKTGIVCYDYENKKVVAVPNAFISKVTDPKTI